MRKMTTTKSRLFSAGVIAALVGLLLLPADGLAAFAQSLDLSQLGASGAMNTAGQIGGTVALTAIGYAIDAWGWDAPLYGVVAVYLVGSLFWAVIDPTKPVVGEEPAAEAA